MIALILFGLLLAAIVWVGVRATMAKSELESAVPLARSIQSAMSAGDENASRAASRALSAHAREAASLTSDPVWRSFEMIPVLGANFAATRKLAQVVEDVSDHAVRPLADFAGGLNPSAFKLLGGAVDLQPLIDAQPVVAAANSSLSRARDRLAKIDTSATIGPVREAVDSLDELVSNASRSLQSVDRALRLAPDMLGFAGPRSYLLMFQNNAEVRATGGLPGAFAQIDTNNGHIGLAKQATPAGMEFPNPVLDLPAETRGVFSDRLTTYIGDITLTPHFPTTGRIVQEMWKRTHGIEVDGVISVDPVALSYLLRATGPITLATGDVLTSDSAVQMLLSDVYERYDEPTVQDGFFASAASAVFAALSSGQVDPKVLITALVQGGEERRLLIWSAHNGDQQVLTGTTLTGDLPVSDASAERLGVYLNDATGAKMDKYLDVGIGLGEATCRKDNRPYYAVDVTLTNTAPADAATSLSQSVTGPGTYGVGQGNVKTLVLVYGPKDSQNLGVARDNSAIPYHPATDSGHPVSQIGVELAPGETSTTRFYLLGGKPVHGKLEAVSTPVLNGHETSNLTVSCDIP